MRILTTTTGPFRTNTYIVVGQNNEGFIIDAGGDLEKINQLLEKNNVSLRAFLLTHEHFDHCMLAAHYREQGLKIYAHEKAVENIKQGLHRLTALRNVRVKDFEVDYALKDGEELNLCGVTIRVIHTPGHSSGSVCFVIDDVIFSGDTLFFNSIGRADLPTGDHDQLISSIKNKLLTLKGDYRILPGHAMETTLSLERRTNKYLE